MFHSSGLFKDVSCPFFLFGLCERPFCHFKHSRHEEAKARKELEEKAATQSKAEDDGDYTPPTSALQTKLESIEQSIRSEKNKISNGNKVVKGKTQVPLKTKPTGTPSYSPTPLNELQKQRVQGKLGSSKYELAMLDGPSSSGEYDPASNFNYSISDGATPADNIPDYAKELHHGVKRSPDHDDDEGESPLAKIPKFVSVEYTPAVEAECSDEEPVGDKQDWFSDEGSEHSRDSVAEVEDTQVLDKKTTVNDETSSSAAVLPFEFTADGCVKVVAPPKKEPVIKPAQKDKVKDPPSEKKNENIFSLFKEEFDKEFESVDKDTSKSEKRSSSSSKEKHKGHTLKNETSKHHDSKHKSDSSKSPQKHTSHSHSSKSSDHNKHSKSSKSKDDTSHKDLKENGKSSKHWHSSHKHDDKSRKHSSSENSHSKTSKHHSDSSSKHIKSSSSSSSSSSSHKSSSKHTSSRTHEKSKKVETGSDKKKKTDTKHSSTKRKKIVDLDFDLFGGLNEEPSAKKQHIDDDLSDLDKYFSDEDPFDECLKIFNEANKPSTSTSDKKKSKKPSTNDDIPPSTSGKKRTALKASDPAEKKKVLENKPKPKPSPAQVMMNRYKMIQAQALAAEEKAKEKIKEKVREMSAKNKANASFSTSTSSASKPNIAGASAAFNQYISSKNKKTTAITVTKGAKRKAHTSTVPIAKLKRPVVEISTSSKVATNVRQRYLNMFIDECLKMGISEQEAFDRGKMEEDSVFKRCSNKKIYLNLCVNMVKKLRNEVKEREEAKKAGGKVKGTKMNGMKLSHTEMLDGIGAKKTTFTINRSGGAIKLREEDYDGAELYKRLQPYVLTEEQLRENNFPRTHPEKGGAAMFYREEPTKNQGSTKGYEKLCLRCGKVFEVYPNGKYPVREECVYHWGKAWKKKVAGALDTRYTCCQGDLASEGCQVGRAHVHETNKKENMSGYMKTIPCSPPLDGDYGVYALDCEMVYTTMGIELARVTVIGTDQEPAYESYVKPDHTVVDYNTRFSGITQDDLEDVTTSLREVQAVLLSLFSDKTILMGHSLESDLQALKLIHSTVVDTSVVFPHKLGAPYKRALRNLMIDYLKKIIQDDVAGHDSQEDALACLQLMQFRLKEDARKEARRLSS